MEAMFLLSIRKIISRRKVKESMIIIQAQTLSSFERFTWNSIIAQSYIKFVFFKYLAIDTILLAGSLLIFFQVCLQKYQFP